MPALTYWDYLKLDRLLDCQGGVEGDEQQLLPDELHFIIVHQVYELWFKLALREVRLARDHLGAPRVPEETVPYVVHHLRRVGEILRLGVEQFHVVETLTAQDFLDFRDKLSPASGFQSFQVREMEILLGLEDKERENLGHVQPLDHIEKLAVGTPAGDLARARLAQARAEVSLRAVLNDWLYRTPIQGSSAGDPGDDAAVSAFLEDYLEQGKPRREAQLERLVHAHVGTPEELRARFDATEAHARAFLLDPDPRIRRIRGAILFIESYRELPLLAWPRLLLDTIMEVEEQMVLWRNRHARMVERTIGRRPGTGGSSGVDYLDKTTRYRIFPELWAVRTLLSPRDSRPELRNPEFYGFQR